MSRLTWGDVEDRTYEIGVSRGVLYPSDGPGVVWNGLISVNDRAVGGDRTSLHFDGIKYYDLVSPKHYQAQLNAFTYPKKFNACLGNVEAVKGFYLTRQPRSRFGLSYRTEIGENEYKIHLIYNASVIPGSTSSETMTNSTKPTTHTWTIDAVPEPSFSHVPTSHFIIDSRNISQSKLTTLESKLYGSNSTDPYLPSRTELLDLLGAP